MASLDQQIEQDMKKALMAKDAPTLSTLRFLKSALKYVSIEKRVESLGDAEVQQVIQKQIKQRRESIEQFRKGGRADLAAKETREIEILEAYLPKQLGDEELRRLVETEAKNAGAVSKKDFGRMMKLLTDKLKGQADAQRVSQALGKILQ